jgi:hypothetical protein
MAATHTTSSNGRLFYSNDQQFLSIEDIYISRRHIDGHLLISLPNYDMSDLLFGTLQLHHNATDYGGDSIM